MTVGAILVVPLVFVIPWTRRWYWYWRQGQPVTPSKDPNASLEAMLDRIRTWNDRASRDADVSMIGGNLALVVGEMNALQQAFDSMPAEP